MITPEDLQRLFLTRQSTRLYDSTKPVEREKLMRCIEAARIAPSACNAQPWRFIVIDNPELKNKVADCTSSRVLAINHYTKQAPIHVAIVREKGNLNSIVGQVLKDKEYPMFDIGIAAIQFCLQATSEGLGTCIMGWFKEKEIKKLLNIPRGKRLELIITLGYPASADIRPKIRKETGEMLSYNSY